jgi:DNA helicase-2/ATP-dependent DNA helicase PcrA
LEGQAAAAVAQRGGHVQIIAAAGSGKTEVVSQRVAALLADGEPAESIVAFTFTEKAAAELKERIRQRVTARLGAGATDQLGRLFVGTIHSYCFRMLQTHVPRYEAYTPLDSNQLTNLLYREKNRLELKYLRDDEKLFKAVADFQSSVDVVENELLPIDSLPEGRFRDTLVKYYAMLDRYQFMSFGTQIVRAVDSLADPAVHASVTADLRHLIVDEYQDVNPAQETLIKLLSKPAGTADLVVVGDDDQAIYQWRGSNVRNIVTFADRYPNVTQFNLLTNRRSRPGIVSLASDFAQSIPERLAKTMNPHREEAGPAVSIAVGFDDEDTEAAEIALSIEMLHDQGVPYRDMAILVRGKVAYAKILDALEASKIPVQPAGRTGLFEQPEAAVFGATYAWLGEIDWAPGRFIKRERIQIDDLIADYAATFDLTPAEQADLRAYLFNRKSKIRETDFNVSLVGDFYDLLGLLKVKTWDLSQATQRNRLGTIARFTNVLADYESVTRRARRDPDNPGVQVGGEVGNEWFYKNFALLLVNYANGSYDDFDGEEDLLADGVALGTVHGAKGLEWPVVFLPSLTNGRFPSSRAGQFQNWLLPRESFDAARYEGSDDEERRLFYVALTRARDWVSLSSHKRVNKQSRSPSPYILEAQKLVASGGLPTGAVPTSIDTPDLAVTYSELASYADCPQSYLLRNEFGFTPPLVAELGYGNAVHHIMRILSERAKASGKPPTDADVDHLLTEEFFLPFANKAAHREMREKARRLISTYLTQHQDDLLRTWATERPFELYLPGVVVSGRADVIYDEHDGVPDNLAIVDYKSATGGDIEPLQLQVYADAGRREGLTVSAAFIHDMATETEYRVAIDSVTVAAAEAHVIATAEGLRQRDFTPKPELKKCRRCDVRNVCGAAKLR